MEVGFIGLGDMGLPMVSNLLATGKTVRVHDSISTAIDQAVDLGAAVALSVAELAKAADVIITILPGAAVVHRVVAGPDGVLHHAQKVALIIDSRSIHPHTAVELAMMAKLPDYSSSSVH